VDSEIQSWFNICNSKKPEHFILGGKPVGQNKFLLKSVSESEAVINSLGKKVKAKIDLSFEEFVRYGYKQEQSSNSSTTAFSSQKTGGVDYKQILKQLVTRDNPNAAQSKAAGTKAG
jgi:hypothetical protein